MSDSLFEDQDRQAEYQQWFRRPEEHRHACSYLGETDQAKGVCDTRIEHS